MPTSAAIGFGAVFAIGDGGAPEAFTAVAEVYSIVPPGRSRPAEDATHHDSADAYAEFIAGLKSVGEITIELNFTDAGETALLAAFEAGAGNYRITAPGGRTYTFAAVFTGFTPGPLDMEKRTATATFMVSGKPVIAAAVAPTNTLAPSISGVAQAGEVLTAIEGVWTGSPAFTYQWQHQVDGAGAWSNISAATARTYTVSATYVTDALRVVVTGTNAAGSDSENSAATAIVIAA